MTGWRRAAGAVTAVLVCLIASSIGAASADATTGTALIQGSGSSWAANAVNQWIADVHQNGLQVVFTSSGSAQGRKDFANKTVDFAVSDIGYQGTDPTTHQDDTSQGRDFAYLPIVAGGTSLPYQIRENGQLVRNLRLSGETIAKIFTNQITNWDDPAITKDNNGKALPSLPIIPVVHSEGSGSTYQFTRWMATEYPNIWKPYSGLGATEYFPAPQGSQVAENGSDSLMNFLSSAAANGAIGYDEYSYALGKDYPVAKVLNKNGYYTLPNQYNVAVALTKAQINMDKSSPDYLLQDLDNVYVYNDPRVYPISSYSYAIIPTSSSDSQMTSAKRQTLADYLDFSVCQGQAQMGQIGYSPLPINLVQASFDQVKKLHSADSSVDISQAQVTACDNPTFEQGNPKANHLAEIAPMPPACDKIGAGPCTGAGSTGQTNPPPSGGGEGGSGGNGGNGGKHGGGQGNGGGGSGSGGNGGTGGTGGGGTGTGSGATGGGSGTGSGSTGTGSGGTGTGGVSSGGTSTGGGSGVDPVTGQQNGGTTNGTGSTNVAGVASMLPAAHSSSGNISLAVLVAAMLLGVLVVPPVIAHAARRRSRSNR